MNRNGLIFPIMVLLNLQHENWKNDRLIMETLQNQQSQNNNTKLSFISKELLFRKKRESTKREFRHKQE